MSSVPVPESIGRVRFDVTKSLWLWTLILVGGYGLCHTTPALMAGSAALIFVTICLGMSVGLHRGLIHATFRAPRVVMGVLAYFFVLGGIGGPLAWARLHAVRDHWQNQPDCPQYFGYRHSMLRDFFWNLHCRFEPADDRALTRLPEGLLDDPWLRFLERTWPLHTLVLALLLGPAAATLVCARIAMSHLGHWAVNYATHVWGERRYVMAGASENGTNIWLLGVLTFGEGFHNNHHAFPRSARIGVRRFDLDVGWLVIRALERAGLVRDVLAWDRP